MVRVEVKNISSTLFLLYWCREKDQQFSSYRSNDPNIPWIGKEWKQK